MKDKMKKIKKEQWVVVFLAGVLILVILIPTGSNKEQTTQTEETSKETETDTLSDSEYINQLEKKTEAFIEKMDGVGTAEVMITVKDNGNAVVDKDITNSKSGDDSSYSEQTIFGNDGEDPYVVSNEVPSVDGVVIICDGGDEPIVQENLIDAIEALFSIESHKIKIVKRAGGQ